MLQHINNVFRNILLSNDDEENKWAVNAFGFKPEETEKKIMFLMSVPHFPHAFYDRHVHHALEWK